MQGCKTTLSLKVLGKPFEKVIHRLQEVFLSFWGTAWHSLAPPGSPTGTGPNRPFIASLQWTLKAHPGGVKDVETIGFHGIFWKLKDFRLKEKYTFHAFQKEVSSQSFKGSSLFRRGSREGFGLEAALRPEMSTGAHQGGGRAEPG